MEIGYLEGEVCNRNGCLGIISQTDSEGGCSCHQCAPCSFCCNTSQYCGDCGWDNDLEYLKEQKNRLEKEKNTPKFEAEERVYDENPTWQILKYFDNHLEGIVEKGLTEKEARNKAFELGRNSAYVSYEVRKLT